MEAIPGEGKVRELKSFFQMRLRVSPGSSIKKTTNYFNAPGFVSLLHSDPLVVEEDYRWIRQWELEKGGFFVVS